MTTPEPQWERLPVRAERLERPLGRALLPTRSLLVEISGLSPQQVKDDIRDWKRCGLLDSAEIGGPGGSTPIYWPNSLGLDHIEASVEQRSWLSKAALANLMEFHLPKVKAVNDIAKLCNTGHLTRFQFYDDSPMIAVAEHNPPGPFPQYDVFVWASLMDRQRDLYHRFESLLEALQAQSTDAKTIFLPSRVFIIAADEWIATRALRLLPAFPTGWFLPDITTAWYYRRGAWEFSDLSSLLYGTIPRRIVPPRLGTGRLRPSVSVRGLRPEQPDRITVPPLFRGRGAPGLFQLLTEVMKFPVGAVDHYRAFVGDADASTRTQDRLDTLVELKMIQVVSEAGYASDGNLLKKGVHRWSEEVPMVISPRGQGQKRYATTSKGRENIRLAHGGTTLQQINRTKLRKAISIPAKRNSKRKRNEVKPGTWNIQHEDTVYDVLAQAAEMRCSIGPTWTAVITMADGRRIEPDGVMRVWTPQFGRRWCSLEAELSVRDLRSIERRFRKYGSPYRIDDSPLLVVAYNDSAEDNFHLFGSEYLLRMLTTTMQRLAEFGVFGRGVWSHYGARATLRS